MNDFFYKVNDKEYLVRINYKRIKNIYFRYIDGEIVISCNKLTSKKHLLALLDKHASKLVKRNQKEEGYIYIFGYKVALQDSGEINFTNGEKIIYKDQNDLNKKLKKMYLEYAKKRVEYYSQIMNVPLYKVSVRNMKTRFGSNSKRTKTIHFAVMLFQYSSDTIDSVIVHELAHILVFNHSKAFYDVVYKYCPNYDIYRKKLIRGIYD